VNRTSTLKLTRRLVDHVRADTTDSAIDAWALPAEHFLDEERWRSERDQFFLKTPQPIGFAGEVSEPGSVMTCEVMGVPVVVTRDRDGELRAFLNVCAHRGARVAVGCGPRARLVCRFHGWSYGLDGQLAGRGRSAAFEPDRVPTGLQPLPVTERGGILVVGVGSEIDPDRVEGALADISSQFEGLGFDHMRRIGAERIEVEASWKLVVSLSHEGYHFQTLHRDSLAPMMTGHGAVDEFGLHTRWAFPMRGIEALHEKPESDWPSLPQAALVHTLYPGTVVVANGGNAQMIRVEPGDRPGSSVVHFSSVADPEEALTASRETYESGLAIFENEDLPIAVECQRGIETARRPVVFGQNEPVVQMWHRRWIEELV
jgi:carnitine monooxygenase subunit